MTKMARRATLHDIRSLTSHRTTHATHGAVSAPFPFPHCTLKERNQQLLQEYDDRGVPDIVYRTPQPREVVINKRRPKKQKEYEKRQRYLARRKVREGKKRMKAIRAAGGYKPPMRYRDYRAMKKEREHEGTYLVYHKPSKASFGTNTIVNDDFHPGPSPSGRNTIRRGPAGPEAGPGAAVDRGRQGWPRAPEARPPTKLSCSCPCHARTPAARPLAHAAAGHAGAAGPVGAAGCAVM